MRSAASPYTAAAKLKAGIFTLVFTITGTATMTLHPASLTAAHAVLFLAHDQYLLLRALLFERHPAGG